MLDLCMCAVVTSYERGGETSNRTGYTVHWSYLKFEHYVLCYPFSLATSVPHLLYDYLTHTSNGTSSFLRVGHAYMYYGLAQPDPFLYCATPLATRSSDTSENVDLDPPTMMGTGRFRLKRFIFRSVSVTSVSSSLLLSFRAHIRGRPHFLQYEINPNPRPA